MKGTHGGLKEIFLRKGYSIRHEEEEIILLANNPRNPKTNKLESDSSKQ